MIGSMSLGVSLPLVPGHPSNAINQSVHLLTVGHPRCTCARSEAAAISNLYSNSNLEDALCMLPQV